ncbi:transposase [Streptomyces anthocyanicus]|uniref:transposase n=1 Tax=Streptomyces anthocyanicus TaxID=68174 RepID=UPI0032503ACF
MLVTPASTTDRDAACLLLPAARGRFGRLTRVWADGGYTGHLVNWSATQLGVTLDIVRRSDDTRGFQILPRRWVVERSYSRQAAHSTPDLSSVQRGMGVVTTMQPR